MPDLDQITKALRHIAERNAITKRGHIRELNDAADMLEDARGILIDVANFNPLEVTSDQAVCTLCHAEIPWDTQAYRYSKDPEHHKDTCGWRRAWEWILS